MWMGCNVRMGRRGLWTTRFPFLKEKIENSMPFFMLLFSGKKGYSFF
jgi:hypothetical protein